MKSSQQEQQHQQQPSPADKTIAVLTLAKHANGVWITKLADELRSRFQRISCSESIGQHTVEVLTVESFDLDRCPTSSSPPWAGVVNRVSDAADPILVKSSLAILRAADLWSVPIFNGPRSYSICCNKLLHHHVFARSGLRTPRSVVVRFDMGTPPPPVHDGSDVSPITIGNKLSCAGRQLESMGCQWPLLIKPNSAGFGAGIQLFANQEELLQYSRDIASSISTNSCRDTMPSEDGMALLQEYIRPIDDCIYRVWFLRGRAQCAVRRILTDPDSNPANDFTTGCAGGSCSLDYTRKKQKILRATTFAWDVPSDIKEDILRVSKVMGDDCDAGSVELLYDQAGCKIYFDLNLLSTLPLMDGSIANDDNIWPEHHNPWTELADAVIEKLY